MRENVQLLFVCVANRQAGQLMVTHQRVACSWNTRPNMVVPEDRASSPPSPNVETAFILSSLCFYRGKLHLLAIDFKNDVR